MTFFSLFDIKAVVMSNSGVDFSNGRDVRPGELLIEVFSKIGKSYHKNNERSKWENRKHTLHGNF